MGNNTFENAQLPKFTLRPVPPLVQWISDFHLSLVLPIVAYWFVSLVFWYIDRKNIWSQYRIHTPVEFKQRNRVGVREVLRSVILQQIIQTSLGLLIGYLTGPGDLCGREEYDIARWTGRVHETDRVLRTVFASALPWSFAVLGVDYKTTGAHIQRFLHSYSIKPSANILQSVLQPMSATIAFENHAWSLWIANLIYWVVEPAFRFGLAIFFSDSWQYFWHRAMHSNRWMYRTMHAHHHRLYVPYAFGAFYNTLSEAFILDTIGTTLSIMLSGLTIRQTMWFSTISVMKGVDDHCGYVLPWDPLQWFNEQNTAFHDVHHQSWGIKSNYSQLYTTFWDHACGTVCLRSSEEMKKLYESGRSAAEKEMRKERLE